MSSLPPHLQHLQHLQGDELKLAIQQEYYSHAIAFILRQTDYDVETAVKHLNVIKDPVKVVKEYLGLDNVAEVKETNSSKSKNQMKYGEIRKFMDEGAKQYNAQKELNERRAKYQAHLEQQQQKHLEQQPEQQPELWYPRKCSVYGINEWLGHGMIRSAPGFNKIVSRSLSR